MMHACTSIWRVTATGLARAALCLLPFTVGCRSVAPLMGEAGMRPLQGAEVQEWPPPPAPARIRSIASFRGPAELGMPLSWWGRAWRAVSGTGDRLRFSNPQAVSIDEDGRLYVADSGSGKLWEFDLARMEFRQWEVAGDAALAMPVSVAVRGDRLYVVDAVLAKVFAFDRHDQAKVLEIGSPLERPAAVAVVGDEVWVADVALHQVMVFDADGRYRRRFGRRGSGDGEFNFPTHIAPFGADRVLVTDALNNRVVITNRRGEFLGAIGSAGQVSGHFSRPKGVAEGPGGTIYVVDAVADALQLFDKDGRFLLDLGETGEAIGQFWLPSGIAIDSKGDIFVADCYNKRIQVFKYIGP